LLFYISFILQQYQPNFSGGRNEFNNARSKRKGNTFNSVVAGFGESKIDVKGKTSITTQEGTQQKTEKNKRQRTEQPVYNENVFKIVIII